MTGAALLLLGLAGCGIPRVPGGWHHGTTTTTSTTTTVPVVHCDALGCAGVPPDPVLGCFSGLPPVDGICP